MKKFITVLAISAVFNSLNAQVLEHQQINSQRNELIVEPSMPTLRTDNLDSVDKKQQDPEDEKLLISLFPNPCHEEINIQLKSKIREGQVSIYNQNGQLCKVFMINQLASFSVNHDLNSGLYTLILRVENESDHLHFKVK